MFCEIQFVPNPKRPAHSYCSIRCREKHWHILNPNKQSEYNRKARLAKPIHCRNCQTLIPNSIRKSGLVYCSSSCRLESRKTLSRLYQKKKQEEFSCFKINKGCSRCGYSKCASALDFHHLDPHIKERRITARMWYSGLGAKELEKCILVCKNCHYEIHEELKINGDLD